MGDPRLETRLTGCPDFQWILEIRLTDPAVPISNATDRTVLVCNGSGDASGVPSPDVPAHRSAQLRVIDDGVVGVVVVPYLKLARVSGSTLLYQ